jgi:hypothetical protein
MPGKYLLCGSGIRLHQHCDPPGALAHQRPYVVSRNSSRAPLFHPQIVNAGKLFNGNMMIPLFQRI